MLRFFSFHLLFVFFGSILLNAQNISIEQYKVGDKVDKKYTAFKLSDYQNEQPEFYVKFIGPLGEFKIICFYSERGATPIENMEQIHIYLIRNSIIIDQREESFGREKNPKFEAFYDVFVQYIELKHKWEENDVGAMSYKANEDYTDGLRFVLKDDKLIPLSELSKTDLRIYRNLIFAKYGYVFKSKDLDTYFKATSWYKPNNKVKIEQVITNRDKELTNYMLKFEERMK